MALNSPKDPDPRVFFLGTDTTIRESQKPQYVLLAHQAADFHEKRIEQVLVRGAMHCTNLNKEAKLIDDGPHTVMAFKDKEDVKRGTHVTSHVYTAGPGNFDLRRMTSTNVKSDKHLKRNGRVAWPNEGLEEWEPAGPEHIPARRAPFGGKQKAGEPDGDGFQMVARGLGGNTQA